MKKKSAFPDNLAEKYFNIVEVIFIVLNADQTVGKINRKGCEILEYKEKEVVGKNWFDNFLPENIREETKEVFDKLMAGKVKPVEYHENSVLTKSGAEKIIAWHNTILKDEKGKIVCTISLGEDITERKAKEEALIASEEKYRALIETTDTGFLIINTQGGVIDANQEYVRLTSHNSLDEILGRSVIEWTAEYDLERNAEEIRKTVKTGFIKNLELDYVGKDGIIIPIEVNAKVIETDSGPRILALCRDITERKRIEKEILSVSNIPGENPNPIIRISSDKTILYTNDAFNKLLTDGELSEKNALKILPDNLYTLIDIALEIGKPHIMMEVNVSDKVYSYNIIPIQEHGYVNLYGRDVTERRIVEKELKKRVEDLEQFYEMAVGRELKMKELKKKIKQLMTRLSKYERE